MLKSIHEIVLYPCRQSTRRSRVWQGLTSNDTTRLSFTKSVMAVACDETGKAIATCTSHDNSSEISGIPEFRQVQHTSNSTGTNKQALRPGFKQISQTSHSRNMAYRPAQQGWNFWLKVTVMRKQSPKERISETQNSFSLQQCDFVGKNPGPICPLHSTTAPPPAVAPGTRFQSPPSGKQVSGLGSRPNRHRTANRGGIFDYFPAFTRVRHVTERDATGS